MLIEKQEGTRFPAGGVAGGELCFPTDVARGIFGSVSAHDIGLPQSAENIFGQLRTRWSGVMVFPCDEPTGRWLPNISCNLAAALL